MQQFSSLNDIFKRTRDGAKDFMELLTPVIDHAENEHDRLYFHHIYEEEDHRLDRLNELVPKLEAWNEEPSDREINIHNRAFIQLLQDINLEKFGLHNFLEHLDLALYEFDDPEHRKKLQQLRKTTDEDDSEVKQILKALNEQFDGEMNPAAYTPTDEKEDIDERVKIESYAETPRSRKTKKTLTVGSLKHTSQ